MPSRTSARTCFDSAVKQLKANYEKGQFVPLLESDVTSYIYHLMLQSGEIPGQELHLDTRVVGLEEQGKAPKVDLAVGVPILVHPDTNDRSVIDAVLAVEVKFLAQDMKPAEHANQVRAADEDVAKLSKISARRQKGELVVLVFDEAGYSDGPTGSEKLRDFSQEARNYSVDFVVIRLKSSSRPVLRTVLVGTRLLTVGQKLFAWYKGEEYEAEVTDDGISFDGKPYDSLTEAGCAATGQGHCDGPKFWNLR